MKTEANIENPVVKWAKKHDVLAWKLTVPGVRGVPDRLFIFNNGNMVFVEFKRPNGFPRKLQIAILKMLAKRGCQCYYGDNAKQTIETLEEYL